MPILSPELLFWIGLAVKMVLTAGAVVAVSVAVERSGAFVGALISALPTSVGAAYVILALEQPPQFIADGAVGTAAITAAVSVFALIYTVLAQRYELILSLGVATIVWFALVYAFRSFHWTPFGAAAVCAVVFAVTIPLSWRYRAAGESKEFVRHWFEIPLRALAVAVVVAAVTAASSTIGPFASGMLALFPIIMGSSIVIIHTRIGGKAAASMAAHAQVFLIGIALGALALHHLVAPIGVWLALLAALCVCLAWSGALFLFRRKNA
jgi:branched-subunit amino acid transport protein AzlD